MNISVLIPSYNKKAFLKEALDSVAGQQQLQEIIVVDDASTDGSAQWLKEHGKNYEKLKVLCLESNQGAPFCRNRALSMAGSDHVMFMDADDLLAPHCLQQRAEAIEKNQGYDMWVFPMEAFYTSPGDAPKLDKWTPPLDHLLERFLSHQIPWQTMQPVWNRTYIQHLGGFDITFPRLQDVELHTRALLNGARVKTFPQLATDCYFRVGNQRLTTNFNGLTDLWVDGANRYYNTFFKQIPAGQQRMLCGTLLETLAQVMDLHSTGHIGKETATAAAHRLISQSGYAFQRTVLRAFAAIMLMAKINIPGTKKATRMFLKVPTFS